MPTVTFFLRSNNDKSGTRVLYCRVTVNGTSSEFSTREKLSPEYWKQESQQYRSWNKEQNRYIETLCDSIRYKIKTAAIVNSDCGGSAQQLIEALNPPKPESNFTILQLIDQYIEHAKRDRSDGTITNHLIKAGNLRSFEKHIGKQLTPVNFDLPTANQFIDWFRSTRDTKNYTTATRNVLFFKTVLEWAAGRGYIRHFELSLFKGRKDPVKPPVYLSHDEVMRLVSKQFNSRLLQHVRDLFLFQAATGLSYGDIWARLEIKETPAGKVIVGRRSKNAQAFFVPAENMALVILDNYKGELPRICNGTYNRVLKELAAIVGIEKRLTTHAARKTFATLKDENGWSRESIAAMLGHRSVRTTETYYLGESTKRIELEMKNRSSKD